MAFPGCSAQLRLALSRAHWLLVLLALALAQLQPLAVSAQTPTPTPDTSLFVGQVRTLPRVNAVTGPQDVEGIVRGATAPIAGARIRVRWAGGGAETTTAADGSFKFTLTPGTFRMELVDRPARPLDFVVAPNQQVRIEFVELREQGVPQSQPVTGTGSPTAGASGTPTPDTSSTPTPTVSSTPTPSQTPTPTKTPVLTPVPLIGTPISIIATPVAAAPMPTSRPSRQSLLPELADLSISTEPWLSSFLFGGGVGAGLVVVGMIVAFLRR